MLSKPVPSCHDDPYHEVCHNVNVTNCHHHDENCHEKECEIVFEDDCRPQECDEEEDCVEEIVEDCREVQMEGCTGDLVDQMGEYQCEVVSDVR